MRSCSVFQRAECSSRINQQLRWPMPLTLRGRPCRQMMVMAAAGGATKRDIMLSVKGLGTDTADQEALQAALSKMDGVADVTVNGNVVALHADASTSIGAVMHKIRNLNKSYRPFPYVERSWQWRGQTVNYAEAGDKSAPAIVMVHGFGASIGSSFFRALQWYADQVWGMARRMSVPVTAVAVDAHPGSNQLPKTLDPEPTAVQIATVASCTGHFRKMAQQLALKYHVYAIDLLGFGASAKPAEFTYNPYLWEEQVAAFCQEVVKKPAVLVGNSIGSQVCTAVASSHPELVAALCLLNCTGGMNQRGLYGDDPRMLLLMPIFAAFELALKIPPVASKIFDNFRSRDRVAELLTSPQGAVYANVGAVTDELLDILTEPAQDPGAQNVFVQVFTGDPGPRPEACMSNVTCPVQVQWGLSDPWTPIDGSVARYFKQLAEEEPQRVTFVTLPNTGHCPQDDQPELVLEAMEPWLQRLQPTSPAAAISA